MAAYFIDWHECRQCDFPGIFNAIWKLKINPWFLLSQRFQQLWSLFVWKAPFEWTNSIHTVYGALCAWFLWDFDENRYVACSAPPCKIIFDHAECACRIYHFRRTLISWLTLFICTVTRKNKFHWRNAENFFLSIFV